MNEKEIERKLAEILASRGNILPGFSSNGGQLGDQLMVSLDGIRDAIQGIALTSIPPGKIGAVYDKFLQQWYILSNEQPIVVREDKSERQRKEKPRQPDSTITLSKTKEYPKILVLHKNPNYNSKLYEYNIQDYNYYLALQKINYETLNNTIYLKYYIKEDYYTSFKENGIFINPGYLVNNFAYFNNVNEIKEKYKRCSGETNVGSGTSGNGTSTSPYITEDIRKMDSIIKAHPGYSFFVYWSVKVHEEGYAMSYFWGQYITRIKFISTGESFGDLNPLPPKSNVVHETGGTHSEYIDRVRIPDLNSFGPGNYVSCGDVNTCADRTEGNFGETIYFQKGTAFIKSSGSPAQSLIESLTLQENFHGSVNGRECNSLYVPQDYVCWVTVTGTYTYSYNYKISGFQATPPNDPEYINDQWPGADYFNTGGGSPGDDENKETCIYPEEIKNTFNIYKIYFYFKNKQYYLDIKCRSFSDQEYKTYYSTYTHKQFHYDIITQKILKFIPDPNINNPNPTDNYKIIYIDLFYFDETKEEIHNFTVLKCYFGFILKYNPTFNADYFLNTAIPWEYKVYKKDSTTNKFVYKEEDIIYYNQNLQVVFENNAYIPKVIDMPIPSMFEDWALIIEKDWRRNISQVYLEVNETNADTQCIKNIRESNYYTTNIIEPTPSTTTEKKGTIHFIDPEQQLKEFNNKTLKEIIFNTTKKINIVRTDSDYKIGKFDPQTTANVCKIEETGFKLMNIDGIVDGNGDGEYSLEGIIYSKNNKTKEMNNV